ncbi:hypothetical protein SAMN05216236_103135 [Sedimentitalea nanhaiensis]|uniref:Uncharacterized protein n=1 Tax=Sedimentitalea nanhaiensis TaxID=999627 RepID=A0A1I6YZX4_9RHOB|nr:hypothetical protein SAMN05216236_103135 [Sedimentitalea nanhaiensis]
MLDRDLPLHALGLNAIDDPAWFCKSRHRLGDQPPVFFQMLRAGSRQSMLANRARSSGSTAIR